MIPPKNKKKRGRIFLSLFFIPFLLLSCVQENLSASSDAQQLFSSSYFEYFDTYSILQVYTTSQEEFDRYSQIFEESLLHYHQLFDIYNEYNTLHNLKTINDQAGGTAVSVESDLLEFLEFCQEMYELTNGKTNILMGSVLRIWHDYREEGSSLPDMALLQQAAAHTQISSLVLDWENSTVCLTDSNASIDVGALAKGYAVQKIACLLQEEGLISGAISIGGSVKVVGPHPDGSAWSAGIIQPSAEREEPYAAKLKMLKGTLTTSGSYERYYTVDGQIYHHIIDPETLLPPSYYLSVSVLTDDAGWGDALATALFCMEFSDGLQLINSLENTEAFWIFANGETYQSDGFSDFLLLDEDIF